eukprot:jgi/Mesvir1/7078/Mv09189-RA.1
MELIFEEPQAKKERRLSRGWSGNVSLPPPLGVDELLVELGPRVPVLTFPGIEGLARSLHMEFFKEARSRIYQGKLKGTQVLVKRMLPYPLNMAADEDIVAEAQRLYDLRHGCLIRTLGVIIDNKERAMVHEFVAGTLANVLDKHRKGKERAEGMCARFTFSKEQRMYAILQVASAVTFLHEQQPPILHGAVCAFNVGMVGKRCRLGDFIPQDVAGQPWEAPEVAQTDLHAAESGDTYGFGTLLMELVTGQPLESADGTLLKDIVLNIFRDAKDEDPEPKLDALCLPDIQWPIGMVKVLLNVALWCTAATPSKRPSMRACLTKLCELAAVIIPDAVKSLPESIWESGQDCLLPSPRGNLSPGVSSPVSSKGSPRSPSIVTSSSCNALAPQESGNAGDSLKKGQGMPLSPSAACLSSLSQPGSPSSLVRFSSASLVELDALNGSESQECGSPRSPRGSGKGWFGKAKEKIKSKLERRKSDPLNLREELGAPQETGSASAHDIPVGDRSPGGSSHGRGLSD